MKTRCPTLLLTVVLAAGVNARAQAPGCSRQAGSLPDPSRPAGQADPSNPIGHIVVSMQENHSFDQYFGRLSDAAFYGSSVDGISTGLSNPDPGGAQVAVFHQTNRCLKDPDHEWDAEHKSWNNGANDGFVRTNGTDVMCRRAARRAEHGRTHLFQHYF
jgi:phospholipase C